MARPVRKETLEATTEERTWRVEIFVENGNNPIVVAHRELVTRIGDRVITEQRGVTVQRTLSQIADEKYDGISGAQMAKVIAGWVDRWREEDIEEENRRSEEAARRLEEENEGEQQ